MPHLKVEQLLSNHSSAVGHCMASFGAILRLIIFHTSPKSENVLIILHRQIGITYSAD